MSKSSSTSVEKIQTSYKRLAAVAANLNSASDELGGAVSSLDAALKKLNLGVSANVQLAGSDDPQTGHYWSRDLGYGKVGPKWGIFISTMSGHYNAPDNEDYDEWLFNDAPRAYRIEAIEKIPDLIEALIKKAEETTENIKSKTTEAMMLADAIGAAAPKSVPRNK